MRLVELLVDHLADLPSGTYSFACEDGMPQELVVLDGEHAGVLVETIAALLEGVRAAGGASPASTRAWWSRRRASHEARLRARWALTDGEAALAETRTAVMEWRFGPGDHVPRELRSEGTTPACACAPLARYAHVNAHPGGTWYGDRADDPLAKGLTALVKADIAATRALCRPGLGLAATVTPDTLTELNRVLAPLVPELRLQRIPCGPGGLPVDCLRNEEGGWQRVKLDQLAEPERDAIHIVASLLAARVRESVVLVDGRELRHGPFQGPARWLGWLAGVAATNQLFVAVSPQPTSTPTLRCGAR